MGKKKRRLQSIDCKRLCKIRVDRMAYLLGEITTLTLTLTLMVMLRLTTTIIGANPWRWEKPKRPRASGKTVGKATTVALELPPTGGSEPLLKEPIGPNELVEVVLPPVPGSVKTNPPLPVEVVDVGVEPVVMNPNGVVITVGWMVCGLAKLKANNGLKKSKPLGAKKKGDPDWVYVQSSSKTTPSVL